LGAGGMSPFAIFFQLLRRHNGLRQHELAKLLGYEQAYISAIELGHKSPSQEFLDRLGRQINLNDLDRAEMLQAIHKSRRRFVLPVDVSAETYQLCSELWDKIDRLHPAQIQAIRQMIKLDDEIGNTRIGLAARISQKHEAEAKM
jgi:transcriptional regulator with XRE-family HTH domain